jgi:hypothetical protein
MICGQLVRRMAADHLIALVRAGFLRVADPRSGDGPVRAALATRPGFGLDCQQIQPNPSKSNLKNYEQSRTRRTGMAIHDQRNTNKNQSKKNDD